MESIASISFFLPMAAAPVLGQRELPHLQLWPGSHHLRQPKTGVLRVRIRVGAWLSESSRPHDGMCTETHSLHGAARVLLCVEPTLTDNLLCCRPTRHKQETREDRMKHRLGCTTPCHPTILGHMSTRCASRQKTWEGMLGKGNQAAATGMLCRCSDTHSPVLPSARQGTGVLAGGNQVAATGTPSTGSTASRSHRSCSWAGAAPPSSPLLPAACSALLPAPAVPGCSPDCAAGCAGLSAVRARQIWSCADFLRP